MHFILFVPQDTVQGWDYESHFIDEERKTQRGEEVYAARKGIFETRLALLIPLVSKLWPESKTLLWVQGPVVKWFSG